MIIARYAHRLPADYDLGIIRKRARERAPLWDAVPELYFKAFLLREKGRFGAEAGSYSVLYLWRQNEAFRDFLGADRDTVPTTGFKSVTDSFGRPHVQTWLVLDARKGRAHEARFASTEELDIPVDADLSSVFAGEAERNRQLAARPGVVAAVAGVDTLNWKLIRILLSAEEATGTDRGVSYQILHLARPLLDTLAPAAER